MHVTCFLVDSFGRKVNNDDEIILMQVPAEKSPTDYHDTIDVERNSFPTETFLKVRSLNVLIFDIFIVPNTKSYFKHFISCHFR